MCLIPQVLYFLSSILFSSLYSENTWQWRRTNIISQHANSGKLLFSSANGNHHHHQKESIQSRSKRSISASSIAGGGVSSPLPSFHLANQRNVQQPSSTENYKTSFSVSKLHQQRTRVSKDLQDISASSGPPHVDKSRSTGNVSVMVGTQLLLTCRVPNIGQESVSIHFGTGIHF